MDVHTKESSAEESIQSKYDITRKEHDCMGKENTNRGRWDLAEVLATASCPTERNIAIEFECGGCCKKVLNGEYIDVLGSFVILRPRRNQDLIVKLFSGGELAELQTADVIIIPVDRICSIEFGAVELDNAVEPQ
jgi:hypothetical protein